MNYIDLHMHSRYSDGNFTPRELVEEARKKGLVAIAVTDHDTTDGLEESRSECERFGIKLINGVEINSHWLVAGTKVFLHVLGYNFHLNKIRGFMNELKDLRYEHNAAIAQALRNIGVQINYEELGQRAQKEMITRFNFAISLVQYGYAKDVKEALSKFLHKGGTAYVEYKTKPFDVVAKKIHEAGGVVCLAHPAEYKLNDEETEKMIESLIQCGLDGIECIHPSMDVKYSQKMTHIARQNHLIITGGSDFHGRIDEEIVLGVGGDGMMIPENLLSHIC